ncbi:hypothetical protein JAAARDRAFT_210281 [Jaapia argillacea MUCL 33604]|uniref:F-box domain-containing protein n=1 Tax=Jaapia argillacea MUCL 33604 TaxID=933084 RepID=A0A067PCZ5_9AGAM|nr:hypothetical protein JAAARDRAFT_210281 [Jaapia argillacea MUCL 33604]
MSTSEPHHRVLFIPELLENIFCRSEDVRTLARSALVCKQWSDLALNTLWYELDTPVNLFKILAPLEESQDEEDYDKLIFRNTPTSAAWVRFDYYARKVRMLAYIEDPAEGEYELDVSSNISPRVFRDLSRARSPQRLLPNLKGLTWQSDDLVTLLSSQVLLHDRIKALSFAMPILQQSQSMSDYFTSITSKIPSLQLMAIWLNRQSPSLLELEAEVVDLLRGLRELTHVGIPFYSLTSKMAEAISQLEKVLVVDFDGECYKRPIGYESYAGNYFGAPRENLPRFSPQLQVNSFPSLTYLAIGLHLQDLMSDHILRRRLFPPSLQRLVIQETGNTTPAIVESFLESIAVSHPHLSTLSLQLRLSDFPRSLPLLDTPRITFTTIKPILGMRSLIEFMISHDYPLSLTDRDMQELAIAKPLLQYLSLNSEPGYPLESSLSLAALLPFAEHCPSMIELKLYMDTTISDFPTLQTNMQRANAVSLLGCEFSPGFSRIEDTRKVMLFLGQILRTSPYPTTLGQPNFLTGNYDRSYEACEEVRKRMRKWEEVSRALPFVVDARMDELRRVDTWAGRVWEVCSPYLPPSVRPPHPSDCDPGVSR